MANCTNCGAPLKDGTKFCTECGTTVPAAKPAPPRPQQQPRPQTPPQQTQQTRPHQEYAQPAYTQPEYTQTAAPMYGQLREQEPGADSPYALITPGGYIGISLLMCIPVVGILLMIVWACGGCRKIQKRNLARAGLIMMVISLILSLIFGLVFRTVFKNITDEIKEELAPTVQTTENAENTSGLGALFSLIGGGSGTDASSDTASSAIPEGVGSLLSGILGNDWNNLEEEINQINEEAEQHSDGWPSDLPDYPDGTMNEVESYRTEITGTSAESMWNYVETLKQKGYEFQDFYQFGMSEADMQSMNAWWGTNGKWYLSISYADGTVTVDHMTELPDLSGLLG